jgi:hypothetical protein
VPGAAVKSLWVSPFGDTTNPCDGTPLTNVAGPEATRPSWGPENVIAYESGEAPVDIALLSADTRERCTLHAPGSDENPSWAPQAFVRPRWLD